MGRCEGVLSFMGREVQGDTKLQIQNAICQMGGREVTGRQNCFFLQGNEWSRSYRETNQHPSPPWNFIAHGFWTPPHFLTSK